MAATESRVARVMTSAQETIPGHFFSRTDFTRSIKSKPLTVRFGGATFSTCWLADVALIKIEPSQPYTNIKQVRIFISYTYTYIRLKKYYDYACLKEEK